MIRQAHTYLAGAMGGATLIAIAIAVFVMLVSAQVFRDWPIAALGDDSGNSAVAPAEPAAGSGFETAAASVAGGAGDSGAGGGGQANRDGGSAAAEGRSLAVEGVDSTNGGPVTTGQAGSGPAGGGSDGDQGGNQATPGGSADSPGTSSPSASAPAGGAVGPAGGGGKSAAGSGGESGGGAATPTAQVTDTVNGTVDQVDESALGGTLDKTGVTEVTEGVVNGVAGPESTVGKVVDETVGAVGGLLNPKH